MDDTLRKSLIEFYLTEIDDWDAGKKGTLGLPAGGQRYPLVMREEIKRLSKRLSELRNPNQRK